MAYESVAELLLRRKQLDEQIKEARAHEAALNKELDERTACAIGRVVISELGNWKTLDLDRFREIFCSRSDKFADVVGEELSLMDGEKRLKTFETSLKKRPRKNVPAKSEGGAC